MTLQPPTGVVCLVHVGRNRKRRLAAAENWSVPQRRDRVWGAGHSQQAGGGLEGLSCPVTPHCRCG